MIVFDNSNLLFKCIFIDLNEIIRNAAIQPAWGYYDGNVFSPLPKDIYF